MTREEKIAIADMVRSRDRFGPVSPEELAALPGKEKELWVHTKNGKTVHVFEERPDNLPEQAALLLNFHGGGFLKGRTDRDRRYCCWVMEQLNCMVWDVDYSLAPEAPFPFAAEEAYVSGNATLWDSSCARGCATITGEARVNQNAIVEDCSIVTAGYIGGNAHIAGNAEIHPNGVTGRSPIIFDNASVYGRLGGNITVHENTVILPGSQIDNPTIDALHVYPDGIVAVRELQRKMPVLKPPLGWQEQPQSKKKRHRGEER